MSDPRKEMLTREGFDSVCLELRRFSNPWTIELRKTDGIWTPFCYDAPLTLADAEKRVEEYAADPTTARATFRVIPWLNNSQAQHVRELADAQRAENLALAEQVRTLREALEGTPHAPECNNNRTYHKFWVSSGTPGRLLCDVCDHPESHERHSRESGLMSCNCWKSRALSASPAPAPTIHPRDKRQSEVLAWCTAAFGTDHAASIPQRAIRLLEESIEAYQAADCDAAMAHSLVDYIFAKEPGMLSQELGGVGITLLALSGAAGISADTEETRELARVLSKPLSHFTERNKRKNAAGFVASAPADTKGN